MSLGKRSSGNYSDPIPSCPHSPPGFPKKERRADEVDEDDDDCEINVVDVSDPEDDPYDHTAATAGDEASSSLERFSGSGGHLCLPLASSVDDSAPFASSSLRQTMHSISLNVPFIEHMPSDPVSYGGCSSHPMVSLSYSASMRDAECEALDLSFRAPNGIKKTIKADPSRRETDVTYSNSRKTRSLYVSASAGPASSLVYPVDGSCLAKRESSSAPGLNDPTSPLTSPHSGASLPPTPPLGLASPGSLPSAASTPVNLHNLIAAKSRNLEAKVEKIAAAHNTNRPTVIRSKNISTNPDPTLDVDEHFRQTFKEKPFIYTEADVDDHFAKALGETWLKFKELHSSSKE